MQPNASVMLFMLECVPALWSYIHLWVPIEACVSMQWVWLQILPTNEALKELCSSGTISLRSVL